MKIKNRTRYSTKLLRRAICAVHDRLARTEGRLPQWKRVTVEVVYARTRVTHGCAYIRGTYMKLILQGPRGHEIHRDLGIKTHELRCPHCSGGPEVFRRIGGRTTVTASLREVYVLDRGEAHESLVCDGVTWLQFRHMCSVKESRVTPQYLAALVDHELRHLYGFGHDKMPGIYTRTMWQLEHDQAAWANNDPAFPWTRLPEREEKKREKPVPVDRLSTELLKIQAAEKRWQTKAKRAKTALSKLQRRRKYYEKKLAAASR